jgi:ATP-dependent Clp protease ATP-binding subunit ClpA
VIGHPIHPSAAIILEELGGDASNFAARQLKPKIAAAADPKAKEAELAAETAALDEVQKHGSVLKEEVDEEDIAEVVGAWTGIPVSRLMEGEMQKLLASLDGLVAR